MSYADGFASFGNDFGSFPFWMEFGIVLVRGKTHFRKRLVEQQTKEFQHNV